MDWVAVAVGKLEVRAQHQGAVGARIDANVFTETFAKQISERIGVDGHWRSLSLSRSALSPAKLKSSIRQASAPSKVTNRLVSCASDSGFLPAAMAVSEAR